MSLAPGRREFKGPTAFSISSERHRQSGMNEITQVSTQPQVVVNPDALDLAHNHHAPLQPQYFLVSAIMFAWICDVNIIVSKLALTLHCSS